MTEYYLMDKRPLAVIAIFFIFGIVLARFLPDSVKFPHIFITTLVLILSSFIFSKRQKISNIFLILSIVSFAALLYINSNIYPKNHISHFLEEERLKTSIVGIIKSPVLTRKPYYGKINSTYIFEIEAVKDEGDWRDVRGLSQIRIQTEKDYGYGDRLVVKGTIRNPKSKYQNPKWFDFAHHHSNHPELVEGQIPNTKSQKSHFDYGKYLERQNIFALVNTKENDVTLLSHNYKSNPILKHTYLIRRKLKNRILEKMPLESGAFLSAILLGDRSELPKHLQTAFKNCGVYHIFPIQSSKKPDYSLESHVTV